MGRLTEHISPHDRGRFASEMQRAPTARHFLRRHWLALVLVAAGAAVFAAAVLLLRTMPPSTITMATGSEGGAYHEVGKFYRTILARSGRRTAAVADRRLRGEPGRCCAIRARA